MDNLGPCPLCGERCEENDWYVFCVRPDCDYDINSPSAHSRLSTMGELWRRREADKPLVDELMAALPEPTLLDMLADWFDVEQHFRPHWKRTGVQNDLRKWARAARAVLEKASKRDES